MRLASSLFLLIVLAAAFAAVVVAQDTPDAAATLTDLRAQLVEVQAKEAELQARARQLDEELKPENIEHSLAGIGSTRPEELRESRRRQLSSERDGVRNQLQLVATSRERLESVIRTAEAQAYRHSAEGSAPLLNQASAGKKALNSAWVFGMLAAVGEILGIVVLVIVAMKRVRQRDASPSD